MIIDPRSSVVALDQQSRALGLIQGQPGGQLVMTQIDVTERVAVGDTVITAGLVLGDAVARSDYPRGLLIGHVADVEPDPNALTQTGFVRPALDFDLLDRLLVVTAFAQD
jgi:rod shape-determining protein MreC